MSKENPTKLWTWLSFVASPILYWEPDFSIHGGVDVFGAESGIHGPFSLAGPRSQRRKLALWGRENS